MAIPDSIRATKPRFTPILIGRLPPLVNPIRPNRINWKTEYFVLPCCRGLNGYEIHTDRKLYGLFIGGRISPYGLMGHNQAKTLRKYKFRSGNLRITSATSRSNIRKSVDT